MDAKVEQPPQKRNKNAKVEQPPQKRNKKNPTSSPPPPSFSSLPDDILLNCLARTSRSHYRSLSLLSRNLRSLIYSRELYQSRSLIGNTEPCLYLCQRLPTYDRWFLVNRTLITNGWIKDELSLLPITPSSSAPSISTTVAVGFEIYQMGGTINGRPSSAVRVFDCWTHTWRDASNMTVAMKRARSAFMDGKIFIIGGTEESSPMNWAEVFHLKTQTWKPLPWPCPDDDAKVRLFRGELSVNSEFGKYVYDSKEERWEELEVGLVLPEHNTIRPWCFIENIKFTVVSRKLIWYDSEHGVWLMVMGLKKNTCINGVNSDPSR